MSEQPMTYSNSNFSPGARRFGRRVIAWAAVAGLAVSMAGIGPAGATTASDNDDLVIVEPTGSVQLSAKVKPGEPVPLSIVTKEAEKRVGIFLPTLNKL